MRIFRGYKKKIPTEKELSEYDGAENRKAWRRIPSCWTCPVCGRTKYEILKWKKRKGVDTLLYGEFGWKFLVHRHHDHGERWSGKTIICSDCNAADGIAKRILKLPSSWSFSPEELSEFVECSPYGGIERIDLDIALDIFSVEQTFFC